ncbi:M48 family metalloprotease [Humibacillus xanthopallidus]|uniref:M48 family metalloprotease n=1 Tax=Humibacillus xanthopallidus TaxID=412689 RepID=UPI00163B0F93|nr:M48 family metallopeptidase [Humibacillus xanthopallidus]
MQRLSWFARRQRASLDRAAERAHRALVARGSAAAPSPTSVGLVIASTVVLLASVTAVALLVWASVQPKGLWGWVGVLVAWAVVAAVVLRSQQVSDAEPLPSESFPHTHRLVAALASDLGVRPPASIHVNLDFNAYVMSTGWRLRPALVIGLPTWTYLTDDERIAILGHELGHLAGRDHGRGTLVGTAHVVLVRLATLVTPLPAGASSNLSPSTVDDGGWGGTATMNWMGTLLLRVISFPAVALLLAFERLAATDRQWREYLADLRAADVAGTAAVVRLLLTMMNTSGLHTLAGSAARRREDPFAVLEHVRTRPAPTPSEVSSARARARQADLRWDDSHPRDDLRLDVVEAHPATPEPAALESHRVLVRAAEAELATLRPGLSRELSHELVETWL